MKFDTQTVKELLFLYRSNVGQLVDMEEFQEDVKRFVYIARILRKYKNSGNLNVRLLLNHVHIMYNCFGNDITEYLINYIDDDLYKELCGTLKFLSLLPKSKYKDACNTIITNIQREIDARS